MSASQTSQGTGDDPALPTSFFSHLPQPYVLATPEEIYDTIMGQIEPELTTSQMPLLDEKYKSESAEEGAKRKQRYAKAFQAYDEKFRDYRREIEQQAQAYQRSVMAANETVTRGSEKAAMSAIESEFSS